MGSNTWQRPDKKEGISATFGRVAPNVFYVFSSNAYPFESGKGYTPFQILGLLKYNGDFKQAATDLPKPEKTTIVTKPKIDRSEIQKILDRIRINPNDEIRKPPTILTIKDNDVNYIVGKRVFSLGNFSAIIGKAKSKKTFFLTLVTGAMLNKDHGFFVGDLPENKNHVFWFDTEQAAYDTQIVVRRLTLLAGHSNLTVFNLREFTPLERCEIIEFVFSEYGSQMGFCVIDGIADLANAINDELEATRISSMLLRLTKVHDCHIATVIHQNKNDNFATGHVGSSIMKKAEIIISVTKHTDDSRTSLVKCDMSRAMDFKEFSFSINSEGLPVVDNEIKYKPSIYEKEDSEEAPF